MRNIELKWFRKTEVRIFFEICFVICFMLLFLDVGMVKAAGETDGISTYKSTEYSSVASVFGNGETIYIMVMDWVQTIGGSSIVSITNGTETISVYICDNGAYPDTKANDGHYWGVFTVGTSTTNDGTDYLHLNDGEEATMTADVGSDGTSGTATILTYYSTNPTKITVQPGESIQEAINNLPAEGGVVKLETGIHNVYETIVINKSNVTIQGTHDSEIVSRDSSKDIFAIPHEDPSPDEPWDTMPVLRKFLFKGFKVTSTYEYETNRNAIVHAYNVDGITMEDVLNFSYAFYAITIHLPGQGGPGVKGGSKNIFVKNNNIHNSGIAKVGFSKNIHVHNNIGTGTNSHGIDAVNRNDEYAYMTNNHVTVNSQWISNLRLHAGNYVYVFGNTLIGAESGIYNDGVSSAIVKNNIIRDVLNSGRTNNAGININPQGKISNVMIRNNRIYNNNTSGILTTHYSYGFSKEVSDADIINNVIYNNTGDGVKMTSEYVQLNLQNNIIMNNGNYGINYIDTIAPTIISYNDVWQNTDGDYKEVSAGTGDISVNPKFASTIPNEEDFHLKSTAGRWNGSDWVYDNETSLCIDAGAPSSDYSNELSPNGGRINMGAYGNTIEASKSYGSEGGEHGEEERESAEMITIYPNPYITGEGYSERIIFGGLPKAATIKIYTVSGELVKTIKHKDTTDGGSKEWDISGIASGIYIYCIESSGGKKKGKVSIIK